MTEALNLFVGFLDEQAELIKKQSVRLKEFLKVHALDKIETTTNTDEKSNDDADNKSKSKKSNDPNKPKLPPTEYQLYLKDELVRLKELYPDHTPKERNEMARKSWNERKKQNKDGSSQKEETSNTEDTNNSKSNDLPLITKNDEILSSIPLVETKEIDIDENNTEINHNSDENILFITEGQSDSTEKKKKKKKKHSHLDSNDTESESKKKKKKKDKDT